MVLDPRVVYLIDRLGGYCEPGVIIGGLEHQTDIQLRQVAPRLIEVAIFLLQEVPSLAAPLNTYDLCKYPTQSNAELYLIWTLQDVHTFCSNSDKRFTRLIPGVQLLDQWVKSISDRAIKAHPSTATSALIDTISKKCLVEERYGTILLCGSIAVAMLQAKQLVLPLVIDKARKNDRLPLAPGDGLVRKFGESQKKAHADWTAKYGGFDKSVTDCKTATEQATGSLTRATDKATAAQRRLAFMPQPQLPYADVKRLEDEVASTIAAHTASLARTKSTSKVLTDRASGASPGEFKLAQEGERNAITTEGMRKGQMDAAQKTLTRALEANKAALEDHQKRIRLLQEQIKAPEKVQTKLNKAQGALNRATAAREKFLKDNPSPPSQENFGPSAGEASAILARQIGGGVMAFDAFCAIATGTSPIDWVSNATHVPFRQVVTVCNVVTDVVLVVSINQALEHRLVVMSLRYDTIQLVISVLPAVVEMAVPTDYQPLGHTTITAITAASNSYSTGVFFSETAMAAASGIQGKEFVFGVCASALAQYVKHFVKPAVDLSDLVTFKVLIGVVGVYTSINKYAERNDAHYMHKVSVALICGHLVMDSLTATVKVISQLMYGSASSKVTVENVPSTQNATRYDLQHWRDGIYAPNAPTTHVVVTGDTGAYPDTDDL